uniref:EF-hand domain-containing protein n=1 Tax=Cuerna arida TaxID=1464854 RepID=A0A1B6G1B8_9HEMI
MFPLFKNLVRASSNMSRLKRLPIVQNMAFMKTTNVSDILSNKEIGVYKKLFDKMDSNKDGFLSKDDLRKGLKDFVNYTATEEELKETMDTLDSDKDGSVGFDEFIGYIAWSRQMRTEEAIKYAFETFDKNSDGLINRDELREALVSLGLVPNESLLNNIMRLTDKDSDGNITLDEFRKVFYNKALSED